METRGKLLSLMVVIALLGFTGTAMAQDINTVKGGAAYNGFLKYAKQCKPDGTCPVDKVAKMANLRKGAVIRACNSEFGASAAGPCIAELLGPWKDVTFKAGTVVAVADPCNPDPCKKGQACRNVGGKAECRDVVVAVVDKCKGVECSENAYCNKKNGKCRCKRGWKGLPECETRRIVVATNACKKDPCKNNGVCSDVGGKAVCDCDGTGFSGEFCEDELLCKEGWEEKAGKCFAWSPIYDWVVEGTWEANYIACTEDSTAVELEGKQRCECGSGEILDPTQPVCRSFSERHPYGAAWLAVGIPLLLILALAGFLLWWFFLRKEDGPPPPPAEGGGEVSPETIAAIVSAVSPDINSRLPKAALVELMSFVTTSIRNEGKEVVNALEDGMVKIEEHTRPAEEPAPLEDEELIEESSDEPAEE